MKKLLLRQREAEEAGAAVAPPPTPVPAPLAVAATDNLPKRRRVQGQLPFLTHLIDDA